MAPVSLPEMPGGPERRRGGRRAAARWLAIALVAMAALAAPATAVALPTGPDLAFKTPVARAGTTAAATSGLSGASVRSKLSAALRSAGGASGAWVYDTGGDGTLFSSSASKRRILASNEKLFTTAAALDRFGSTHRLETSVYARGALKGARRQVLDGDLVIVGDGDPALGTESFARRHNLPLTPIGGLARAIAASGIKRVTGKVRADDSIFDRRRGIPATGNRASVDLSPLSGLSFNSGFDGNGYSPAPELDAAGALKRGLRKRDVRVTGVGHGRLSTKRLERSEPLATAASPTLAALAEETNEPSNNFFAEMLIKRLGAGKNKKGTTKRGAKRVKRFAKRVGTKVRARDGSGLSRGDKASPKQVGKLLVAMAKPSAEAADAFRDSLAVAGREGTLASRMRGTAAEGKCEAKTGTLSNVSALSGYCQVGGDPVVFSILMNSVNPSTARNAQDRMAAAIARYER
jgi:D-alanyl-D-alanine carboxypeptidase/D-alanyl-D-alanine-endopeptidase (penicillin-binding protein 4)